MAVVQGDGVGREQRRHRDQPESQHPHAYTRHQRPDHHAGFERTWRGCGFRRGQLRLEPAAVPGRRGRIAGTVGRREQSAGHAGALLRLRLVGTLGGAGYEPVQHHPGWPIRLVERHLDVNGSGLGHGGPGSCGEPDAQRPGRHQSSGQHVDQDLRRCTPPPQRGRRARPVGLTYSLSLWERASSFLDSYVARFSTLAAAVTMGLALIACQPIPAAPPTPPAQAAPPVVASPSPAMLTAAQIGVADPAVTTSLWGNAATTNRDLELARNAGFKWVKQQFEWRNIEPDATGRLQWAEADRIVDAVTAVGFKMIARVDDQPKWASTKVTFPAVGPPDNPQDFADFLTAVAARYKGRIQAYEVWDEPNVASRWGEKRPD